MKNLIALCLSIALTMTTFATPASEPSGTPDAGSRIPPPPGWLASLDALYDAELRVAGLDDRTFGPGHWWDIASPLLARDRGFTREDIGRSVEDRPLRHVAWGEGDASVLLWSQMHGDESTASMALADLFRFLGEHPDHPIVRRLRANTSLHFFPIVNPDGAARFQRRNAQGIDINRDARELVSPEGRTLKALFDQVRPRFGFNLHDQSPGYRVGDSTRQTAIALLAPPPDATGGITDARTRAMEVAAVIRIALDPYLRGHLARWDETFNPQAFGDLTAQWGASTVLVEAGAIEGDPQKQRLRKLYFLALVAALDSIATGDHAGVDTTLYRDLPENGDEWPDLAIRGGTVVNPGLPPTPADVIVSFRDGLSGRGGSIFAFGDLAGRNARETIDASGLFLVPIAAADGAPGQRIAARSPARFHLARDPRARDIVWTLDRDVDPEHPHP